MTTLKVEMPPKLIHLFSPSHLRYRVAFGGRGSGKTYTFAKMLAIKGYMLAEEGKRGTLLCAREFMNSLAESSMEEIKHAIKSEKWLDDYYEMGEKYIRTKNGLIDFTFAGLRHNLDSIKSKAKILIAWVDEAETVSDIAWKKLLPTVREPNSEIWCSYNPETEGSATDVRFRKSDLGAEGMAVEINWQDNPWFPSVLEGERARDERNLLREEYLWIWEGQYRTRTDAQVFADKYTIKEFDTDGLEGLVQGLDFGFSQDPTAAIRAYAHDGFLYISDEYGKIGLELDHTAGAIERAIPNYKKYRTIADNARPESISLLKRHGMRIEACKKGKGSVEDGIAFIKSFDRVIIHPRCKQVINEFDKYSYKTDRITGDVLPDLIDKDNHFIDALRYALEPLMRGRRALPRSLSI